MQEVEAAVEERDGEPIRLTILRELEEKEITVRKKRRKKGKNKTNNPTISRRSGLPDKNRGLSLYSQPRLF